jgi:hypothetical protein
MYCYFDINDRNDNHCLMLRTLGLPLPHNTDKLNTGDEKVKDTNSFIESLCGGGVVWSLCVDNEGNF